MNDNVVQLFGGEDPRISELLEELEEVIYRRAEGQLAAVTVVGVLKLIEFRLLTEAMADEDE